MGKTAEEILDNHSLCDLVDYHTCVLAMNEYANAQTATLKAENERLKSVLKVSNEFISQYVPPHLIELFLKKVDDHNFNRLKSGK